MYSVTYTEFKQLVAMRQRTNQQSKSVEERQQEKVLRADQKPIQWWPQNDKRMATCPSCDAVVDEKVLNRESGLCPICHEEQIYRQR